MMDGDAVRALLARIDEGRVGQISHEVRDPGGYYIIESGGALSRREFPTPPVGVMVYTLDDFAVAAGPRKTEIGFEVFVDKENVYAVWPTIAGGFRGFHIIECPLKVTAAAEKLRTWVGGAARYGQRELLWELRTTFAGCVDPALLVVLRSLRFSKSESGSSQIETGRESIASDIKREVELGGVAVPESFVVQCPAFSNGDPRHMAAPPRASQILAKVHLDIRFGEDQAIVLTVSPDEWVATWASEYERIVNWLTGQGFTPIMGLHRGARPSK